MRHSETIQTWFDTEGPGGLILPSGWFGRPYDNQFKLTSIEEAGRDLTMILSGDVLLRFQGLRSVRSESHELALGPFDNLHFALRAANGEERLIQEHQRGEVKIVSVWSWATRPLDPT